MAATAGRIEEVLSPKAYGLKDNKRGGGILRWVPPRNSALVAPPDLWARCHASLQSERRLCPLRSLMFHYDVACFVLCYGVGLLNLWRKMAVCCPAPPNAAQRRPTPPNAAQSCSRGGPRRR